MMSELEGHSDSRSSHSSNSGHKYGDYNNNIDEDDDGDDTPAGPSAMSMLMSYYGTEGETNSDEKPAAELILTSNFKPEKYLKELLDTKLVDELVRHDATMLSEIRSLDNDMQMLIYENYNKFISATETIKRMKNNVESMEEDMNTVSRKMQSISSSSQRLDDSLANKRSKIDKLIRIKRLLSRLDFFSELPEKLQKMIQEEKYLPAVDLYNKAIIVLTKNSHVLSFKNIKERTEAMMAELRVKVLQLFDQV